MFIVKFKMKSDLREEEDRKQGTVRIQNGS